MNKYVVKNNTKKEYKNIFGKTDYDIPMFGFKSALFILMTKMCIRDRTMTTLEEVELLMELNGLLPLKYRKIWVFL